MVFNSSTIGFEALARNLKCVSFDKRLNSLDTFKKYPKEGIFWMNPQNYKEFERKINKILKILDYEKALGYKILGAGGGGFILCVMNKNKKEKFLNKYKKKFKMIDYSFQNSSTQFLYYK